MNQLSRTQQDVSKDDAKPQHVLLNPPAFTQEYKIVHNETLTQIMKSVTHLNWSVPDQNTLTILVSELSKAIIEKYKTLRIAEISTAFAKGIRGEYGDFMGLSVVTFEKFIKLYLASDYRADLGKSIPKVEATEPAKEPTREERFDLFVFNALNAFNGYQASKDISLVGSSIYLFLRRLNLFAYSEQEQEEFISQAQKEVIAHLQMKKNTVLDKNLRNQIERQLSAPETLEQTIILQAQRLGLYAYFQTLIIEQGDLQQLLAAKREQFFG